MYGCEPRWFSPPEYDDSDAALLKVEGQWLQSDGARAFVPRFSQIKSQNPCGRGVWAARDVTVREKPRT